MSQTTLRIDTDLHKQIRVMAALQDLTILEATTKVVLAGLQVLKQQQAGQQTH